MLMIGTVNRTLAQGGTIDSTFNPDVNGEIFAITTQSDGKILIGGDFTTVNGITRTRLARLNTDGTIDTTFFDPNIQTSGNVEVILLQPDNKIIIGGFFTSVRGQIVFV